VKLNNGTEARRSFGVVVPVLNQQDFIGQALASIFVQSLVAPVSLHVQDGGSTDRTLEVVEAWAQRATHFPGISFSFSSERDTGVPQALNRGFQKVQGDFVTWLGADDIFMPFAFQTIAGATQFFPGFHWITGVPHQVSEDSIPLALSGKHGVLRPPSGFSQKRMASGGLTGGFWPVLQQEGTFWSREAFESVGSYVSEGYQVAFDFELWCRLAHSHPILQISAPLAAFRKRPGQLSVKDSGQYRKEVESIRREIGKEGKPPQVNGLNSRLFFVAYFEVRDRKWVLRRSLFPSYSLFRASRRLLSEFSSRLRRIALSRRNTLG